MLRTIVPTLLVALGASPALAIEGGVFCKSTMTFIERPETNGALSFKVTGTNQRQHYIQVAGQALKSAGGWRFQVKSDKTPEDRCTLDISPAADGFKMHTLEGARCNSSGGEGASEMLFSLSFPASSRINGAVPPSGNPNVFPEFDCNKRAFYRTPTSSPDDIPVLGAAPIGVVRGLIRQDTGGWSKIFAERPNAVMNQYFTADFNNAWTNAMTHEGDVLDGDPITGYQALTKVVERSTDGGETGPATARVTANLMVTVGGETKPEKITFNIKLEDRHWKIDDITDENMPSLRSYFKTNYGR